MQTRQNESSAGRLFAHSVAALSIVGAGLFAGCANPGPPRPPSLQLPALVKDLSAERIGDRVSLRWTTPSRTVDGLEIKGALTAEICRSSGTPTANAKKSLAACTTVKRVSTAASAMSAVDDLPLSLLADPVVLLTYRIEIFNAANRSAGKSTAAYAASGAAPPPVASLTAIASESGAILKWNRAVSGEAFAVDLTRTDPSAPSSAPKHKSSTPAALPVHRSKTSHPSNLEASAANEVHLRAAARPAEQGSETGTVDTTVAKGETYSYLAQQVRLTTIDGHALELRSAPSSTVILVMQDTFPPKPPSGLATIPGTNEAATGTSPISYIDLSWQPNSEPDLAGYLVYRQLARPNGDPQGPLGKLTPLPIPAPAYRDVAVAPGQRYIYSVTAVDASGNESAPSAKAQEVAEAPNVVGSPQ